MTASPWADRCPEPSGDGPPDGLVRRALPRLGRGWPPVAGLISGLLLDGVLEHAPGGSAAASQAWGRLSRAVRVAQLQHAGSAGTYPALSFVTVSPADVAALGVAARALGDSALPGGDPVVRAALRRSATAVGRTSEQLIVELTRMHGVLDIDLGPDGEILRRWGADGPVFVTPPAEALAAHRRIAARVHTMWQAGATGDC